MLSTDQIKQRILNYVALHPGCTDVQLAVNANVIDNDPDGGHSLDIPFLIEDWVDNCELIEIEYTLPTATYRTNSMYFAKQTCVGFVVTPTNVDIILLNKKIKSFPLNTVVKIRGV